MVEVSKGLVLKQDKGRGTLERLPTGRYAYCPVENNALIPIAISFPGLTPTESASLPPFFDGLVPEGWILDVATKIRKDLAKDRYGLLLAFGSDTMGDVSVVPADAQTSPLSSSNSIVPFEKANFSNTKSADICLVCLKSLNDAKAIGEYHVPCAAALFSMQEVALYRYDFSQIEKMARQNLEARLVLPGMQAKASLSLGQDTNQANENRLTVAGFGNDGLFILKPQHPEIDKFPENEMLIMTLAHRLGIMAATCGLIRDVNGHFHYITRRFDRISDRNGQIRRIAMEDFGQIFGKIQGQEKFNVSANQIGKALSKLFGRPDDGERFFRQIYFSFLVGNCDFHARNVAVLNNAVVRLSPAFDLTSTFLIDGADDVSSALLINGKRSSIRTTDWQQMGAACGNSPDLSLAIMQEIESQLLCELKNMPTSVFPLSWLEHLAMYAQERIKERDGLFNGRTGQFVAK